MHIHVHIGHPADVHVFRHAIAAWRTHGHTVDVTTRAIPIACRLLEAFGIPHTVIGPKRAGAFGLGRELLRHIVFLAPRLRRLRIDVSVSFGGTFTVHAARLAGCRALVVYDTEIARVQNRITYPFASAIATPAVYPDDLGPRHVRFNGFKELAYLHPDVFRPDPAVPARYGLTPETPYSMVRFITWEASHDIGVRGLSAAQEAMVLDVLERSGRVWLVPEGSVPEPLRSRAQPCRPEEFHHLLAFARCVVSEGASTAAEAAVLGTPSLYLNPVGRSYIDRLAAYGLVRHIVPEDDVRTTIAGLLARAADGAACRAAAERVIADHENVSEFIVRFVEDR
jgi:uncharacterized protein